jgi:hypothetical protein
MPIPIQTMQLERFAFACGSTSIVVFLFHNHFYDPAQAAAIPDGVFRQSMSFNSGIVLFYSAFFSGKSLSCHSGARERSWHDNCFKIDSFLRSVEPSDDDWQWDGERQ